MEPQQLELILKLADICLDKVSSFPLPGLRSLGFSLFCFAFYGLLYAGRMSQLEY